MTNGHKRHSSLDALGSLYMNRASEPPAPANRSIPSHMSGSDRDIPSTFKPKSLSRINSGEYFTACFGPRRAKDSEFGPVRPFSLDAGDEVAKRTTSRLQRSRSRSFSAPFLGNFNFGSKRFTGKNEEESPCNLETRAPEPNLISATRKNRVVQSNFQWVAGDEQDRSAKPAAWKQALRKLRAEAKRRVHPGRSHEVLTNYDTETYEKNFYDCEKLSLCTMVDDYDKLGLRARVIHSNPLTKLNPHDLEDASGHHPPHLSRAKTVAAAPVNQALQSRDARFPIWQRRNISRPLANLKLARSI